MTYEDYLKCAEKHLNSCKQMLSLLSQDPSLPREEWSLALEIYYLHGYIIEACMVYILYRKAGFPAQSDIMKEIDSDTCEPYWYYVDFKNKTGVVFSCKCLNPGEKAYTISSHCHNRIIENKALLNWEEIEETRIPYIVTNDAIDEDSLCLLRAWTTHYRYHFEGYSPKGKYIHNWRPKVRCVELTYKTLEALIEVCNSVYKVTRMH